MSFAAFFRNIFCAYYFSQIGIIINFNAVIFLNKIYKIVLQQFLNKFSAKKNVILYYNNITNFVFVENTFFAT